MPCYHPITAYQAAPGEPLVFAKAEWGKTARGGGYGQREIACGKCKGCRLRRSREWAIRCMHEKQLHKHNCSLTLTYNEEHFPGYSLVHKHFYDFMKRLREHVRRQQKKHGTPPPPPSGERGARGEHLRTTAPGAADRAPQTAVAHDPLSSQTIRYYMCGEYGEQTSRPHFHACIFGVDFLDKIYHKKTPAGERIYISQTLDKLWGHGYAAIGDVTPKSAAYIARYLMQKYNWGEKYDEIIDPETGEVYKRLKTYNQMSRGNRLNRANSIGAGWLEKFQADAYPHGKIITHNNHKVNTPRYYDKKYKNIDRLAFEHLQYMRHIEQLANVADHTYERLAVQELVKEAQTRTLSRGFQ